METPSAKSIAPGPPGGRRVALAFGAAVAVAGLLVVFASQKAAPVASAPSIVERMREVARLETLDVNVYKKVGYAPEPEPTGRFWADVLLWAKSALAPSRGRAIVFGTVHVGLDLSGLDASALAVHGNQVDVVLPPLLTRAEVHPGETEVIQSNLDSAQTGQLLELARVAFEQDARADAGLQARARASAERALRGLLLSLGFHEVRFVPSLPARGAG